MISSSKAVIEMKQEKLQLGMKSLDLLSPLKTVDRGYAMVLQEGELKTSKQQVNLDLPLVIRMRDGELTCEVSYNKS
jgi:exodeoxyribonuclease VII large subunit